MKKNESPFNAYSQRDQIAGGQQASPRCPEVEPEFAEMFIPNEGIEAPVRGSHALAGPDGGRDR